jgi:hypothetical protein
MKKIFFIIFLLIINKSIVAEEFYCSFIYIDEALTEARGLALNVNDETVVIEEETLSILNKDTQYIYASGYTKDIPGVVVLILDRLNMKFKLQVTASEDQDVEGFFKDGFEGTCIHPN